MQVARSKVTPTCIDQYMCNGSGIAWHKLGSKQMN